MLRIFVLYKFRDFPAVYGDIARLPLTEKICCRFARDFNFKKREKFRFDVSATQNASEN